MLIKIIGGIAVISASSLLGYILSRDCSKRPQQLRELQVLLQMLENEIVFLESLLADAFERIYKSGNSDTGILFKFTAHELKKRKGVNACQAWETAIAENISKTSLNREDGKILASFGKMLGNSDVDGQIKNIRLTVNQLKLQEKKAEEMKSKNEKMYKTLGVLGGLAVVVVLI